MFDREVRRGGTLAAVVKWMQARITSLVNMLVGWRTPRVRQA
jgi:hypothetical protein